TSELTAPAILVRTPYGKDNYRTEERTRSQDTYGRGVGLALASHGYVFVAQDKRGEHESEGRYVLSADTLYDRLDGVDTLDWIAGQSWSNGKVGTLGCSADGDAQTALAAEAKKHLAGQIIQAGTGPIWDTFYANYRAGIFSTWWIGWQTDNAKGF